MPFLSLLIVAAMIIALIDIITRDQSQMKHLPKFAWSLLVIFLPLIGTVLWFALGREYSGSGIRLPRPPRTAASRTAQTSAPQHPGSRTTEQQLADLDREIEEDRLRAEIARRRQQGDGQASVG